MSQFYAADYISRLCYILKHVLEAGYVSCFSRIPLPSLMGLFKLATLNHWDRLLKKKKNRKLQNEHSINAHVLFSQQTV
jgi:hypothetical protein